MKESLREIMVMQLINMGIGIHMEVRPIATDEEIETESKNIRVWANQTVEELLAAVVEAVEGIKNPHEQVSRETPDDGSPLCPHCLFLGFEGYRSAVERLLKEVQP